MYVIHNQQYFYLDFLAPDSHDHHYTTSAWKLALELLKENNLEVGRNIKKIRVWSDGGLKTKENLYYFHEMALKLGVRVQINFFGPHHGHSEVRYFFLKKKVNNNNNKQTLVRWSLWSNQNDFASKSKRRSYPK